MNWKCLITREMGANALFTHWFKKKKTFSEKYFQLPSYLGFAVEKFTACEGRTIVLTDVRVTSALDKACFEWKQLLFISYKFVKGFLAITFFITCYF